MSNHRTSRQMQLLLDVLELSPKSVPELVALYPGPNWMKVVMNAMQLNRIRPNGDFFFDQRKHKRYEVAGYYNGDEIPACCPPDMFAGWLDAVWVSKQPATFCEDCLEHVPEILAIKSAGRCHKKVWELRFFHPKTLKEKAMNEAVVA